MSGWQRRPTAGGSCSTTRCAACCVAAAAAKRAQGRCARASVAAVAHLNGKCGTLPLLSADGITGKEQRSKLVNERIKSQRSAAKPRPALPLPIWRQAPCSSLCIKWPALLAAAGRMWHRPPGRAPTAASLRVLVRRAARPRSFQRLPPCSPRLDKMAVGKNKVRAVSVASQRGQRGGVAPGRGQRPQHTADTPPLLLLPAAHQVRRDEGALEATRAWQGRGAAGGPAAARGGASQPGPPSLSRLAETAGAALPEA